MIVLDYYAVDLYVKAHGMCSDIYMKLAVSGLPSETIVMCQTLTNVVWDCHTGEVKTIGRFNANNSFSIDCEWIDVTTEGDTWKEYTRG